MILLYLVEFLVAIMLIWGFLTQVIMPLWNNLPLFPMLRQEYRLARDREARSREDLQIAEMDSEAGRTERRVSKVRGVQSELDIAKDDLETASLEEEVHEAKRSAAQQRAGRNTL